MCQTSMNITLTQPYISTSQLAASRRGEERKYYLYTVYVQFNVYIFMEFMTNTMKIVGPSSKYLAILAILGIVWKGTWDFTIYQPKFDIMGSTA